MKAKKPTEESLEQRLGERITALRKERDLTQRELAEAVKVSTSLIQRIEIADFWPKGAVLQSIARALGVEPWELFRDSGGKGQDTSPMATLTALKVLQGQVEQLQALERVPAEVREALLKVKTVQAFSTVKTVLDTALQFESDDRAAKAGVRGKRQREE